jgi:hypothetical protein
VMRTDSDGLLAARFAATRDGHDGSDWGDVLQRAASQAAIVHRWRLTVVAALVLLAIAVPSLALSASVRGLFGLNDPVHPDYSRARLLVSAPISGGRVARVWAAPSTGVGECEFVTIDPAGSALHPARMHGSSECTLGKQRLHGRLAWSFSRGGRNTSLLDGRVGASLHAARVELHWHGGSQRLTYKGGFFVAPAPSLNDPPFRRLPYDLVVYDTQGRIVAQSRIPTSFLYKDWKRVQPQLHQYRVAHGCDTITVWRCRSR